MPQKENLAVRESVDSVPELKRPCQLAQLSKTKELRPKYDFDTRRHTQVAAWGMPSDHRGTLKTVFGAFFGHFEYPRVIPNECQKIDFSTLRDVSDPMVTHWYAWAMHADTPCIPVGTPGPLMEHQKGSKQVPSKKLEHDLGGYTPPWTPQGAQSPKHDF